MCTAASPATAHLSHLFAEPDPAEDMPPTGPVCEQAGFGIIRTGGGHGPPRQPPWCPWLTHGVPQSS